MYQGFYELTSGMLTQQRRLETISNNMSNVLTAGFKKDTTTASTFGEEMVVRTGRYNKDNPTELGSNAPIVMADETTTNYKQGSFRETDYRYDFGIYGDGFFAIQLPDGNVQYTRNGQFSVTDDGVLQLDGCGAVLDPQGNQIVIPEENFSVDGDGVITGADGTTYGQIGIYGFDSTDGLSREDNGLYGSGTAGTPINGTGTTSLMWKSIETSNVDMVQEMTDMMKSQRSLQSAAQALRMYDNLMSKAVTDVGRL